MPIVNVNYGYLYVKEVPETMWEKDYRDAICPVCQVFSSCKGGCVNLYNLHRPERVICMGFQKPQS